MIFAVLSLTNHVQILKEYSLHLFIDIKCLENVLHDEQKSLEPDCYKMFTTRIEMFKNADKVR